jgi:squalene cyclase
VVTDAGLTHLAGLTDLEQLGLEGTRVTGAGLVTLKGLPKLKRVRHGGTGSIAPVSDEPARSDKTGDPAGVPGPIAAPLDVAPAQVRAAAMRALGPLQKSLVVYAEKRDCFSCHNQGVPLVALNIARSRGLAIDEDAFQGAVDQTLADLEGALERYREGRGQPGGADRAAYALWALEVGDHPPDLVTGAVIEFLLKADRDRDHWTAAARRVPMEASPFTATALTLRALQYFADKGSADVIKARIAKARSWLLKTKPDDTEDRVFRLWGLKYAGGSPEEIAAAVKDLLATQRGDGGWSQTEALASDSYATGSALVALHEAGGLATDDPAYRRGVAFLVGTQKDDGTWFVKSRSNPFQLYFESGFPYGKDQFIAVAASGWATAALALALPPAP